MENVNHEESKKPTTTSVLSYEQVKRLDNVMQQIVPIHGRGNFPTLQIKLMDLVEVVKSNLTIGDIPVNDIRMNGGAASHILASEAPPYKDVDLIFRVNLENNHSFDKIKSAVLDSLLNFLPEGVSKTRISSCSLKEAYVHKMVKVRTPEGDRWSLISLNNNQGRNVELKFVDVMRRQFEFSVDSFQINLDSVQQFYGCSKMPMSEKFYPTVVAESVFGDIEAALMHLDKKLIATRNPEEIRGGGLLKYCNLLVRDFFPENLDKIKNLEKYMCSRFFIDFNEVNQQRIKLQNYLLNHFTGEDHLMCKYLNILYDVVAESTVCLMGHERRQTLSLIKELAGQLYYRDHCPPIHNIYSNSYVNYNYAPNVKHPKKTRYPRIIFSGNVYNSVVPFSIAYPCNWSPCPIESV